MPKEKANCYKMASSDDNMFRKGQWSLEEDECLKAYVTALGERRWDAIAKASGLRRSGKSCRLRWLNYLRPSLKHSPISDNEEQIIFRLHEKWGNKWARIARRLPGRTDNEIKNYWRGCLRKKTSQSTDQVEDKSANSMEAKSSSSWNSDDDESDYNDIIKELSLEGGKSGEASPSCNEVQEVLMTTPQSPYESHFSNWVLMLKGDQDEMMSGECRHGYQDETNTTALDYCWDGLWDMDLFNFM